MAFVITVCVLTLIVLNFDTIESSRLGEIGVHQLRHSRTDEMTPLDRLFVKLDKGAKKTAPVPTSTPAEQHTDFDDFDETDAGGSLNSLWDDDDSTATAAPESDTIERRWSKLLESARGKAKETEDEEEEEEEDEEDDEEFEEEESMKDSQADGRTYMRSRWTDLSSHKWENMGNRKSVDSLFHQYRSGLFKPDSITTDNMANYEVFKHNKQMSIETLCKYPKPKVVRVSDVYPSTNKLYVPACTILYQCGDDTGCCGGTGQRCGPKPNTSKMVELYFYTTYITTSYGRQRTSSALEKLRFYNQTECECQDRMEDVMPRDSGNSEFRTDKALEPTCKCPSEYTVRHLSNGSCSCDCFDKQRDCIKYKKGKEYFNHQDRLCIEMGTCHLPSCDFGVYLRSSGRCPRKHEKFRSWSRYH